MNLIFLDTETTHLGEEARLVQLAYKHSATGEEMMGYFKPPVPISFEAMAIHHITNDMVAGKSAFSDSPVKQKLGEQLASSILVAHNAKFDIAILNNEGVTAGQYLDTMRIAQHLIEAPQHRLQYLRYFLGLAVTGQAHDAWGDVLILEALFQHLFNFTKQKFNIDPAAIIPYLFKLTQTPVLLKTINFGKYKDKTFEEISRIDRNYLQWLYGSETQKNKFEQKEELVYTLNYYLSGKPGQ